MNTVKGNYRDVANGGARAPPTLNCFQNRTCTQFKSAEILKRGRGSSSNTFLRHNQFYYMCMSVMLLIQKLVSEGDKSRFRAVEILKRERICKCSALSFKKDYILPSKIAFPFSSYDLLVIFFSANGQQMAQHYTRNHNKTKESSSNHER